MRLTLATAALLALLVACHAAPPARVRVIKPKRCNEKKNDCTLDLTALGDLNASPPDEIDVQLAMGGKTRKFKKAQGSKKGKAWVGQDGDSSINLLQTHGMTVGSVVDTDDHTVCSIGADGDGVQSAVCVPSSDFPPEGPPHEDHTPPPPDTRRRDEEAAQTASRRAAGDAIVDVMVPWTVGAECRNAGLARTCTPTDLTTSRMLAKIELAVEETNVAYTASGANVQLNLVHAYRTTYTEDATDAFGHALGNMRGVGDGFLEEVHPKRTQYGADVVALLIDDGQYCGLGYLGPRSDLMFSVTAWNCATGYFSFGHEIGHNFGLNHDKGTTNACTNSAYNYGWRDPEAAFRTILAYNCATGQCDTMPKSGCSRIQRFSTTYATWNGKALGNAETNNARKMNDGAPQVAAYFPTAAPGCAADSECDDGDACTTDTCNAGVCESTSITCDDGNDCTADSCSNGQCVFQTLSCDDGDACTEDSCSASGGCVNTPKACSDGNACTVDLCGAFGECVFQPLSCDDGDACTEDSCDPAGGCVHTPKACTDNNVCTLDSCGANGECVFEAMACDDNDPCTEDSCDAVAGCTHTAIAGCVCNNNGVCDPLEDKDNCPGDCGVKTESAAANGNGICEIGDGETCRNSRDCMGRTSGKNKRRYCCGEDSACGDPRCGTEGITCMSMPNEETGYCGDGTCSGALGETAETCARDCLSGDGEAAPECNDDGVCDAGEACGTCADCLPRCGNGVCEMGDGETCGNCPMDCAGVTKGKPSEQFCCGKTADCSDPRCAARGCFADSVCPPLGLERAITVGADAPADAPAAHSELEEEAVQKANTAMLVAVGAASAVAILAIVVASVVIVNMRWRQRNRDIEGHPGAAKKMEMLLADSQTYAAGGYTVQSSMQMKPVWSAADALPEPLQRKHSLKSAPPLDATLIQAAGPADGARQRPTPTGRSFEEQSPKNNDGGKLVTPTGRSVPATPKGDKDF